MPAWQKRGKEWENKQERQEHLGDHSYKGNCTSHFPLGITEDYQPRSGDDHRATGDFRGGGEDGGGLSQPTRYLPEADIAFINSYIDFIKLKSSC